MAAVVLVAAAFSPWVQTWVVQQLLARQPGMQASVGSVWVRPSSVQITDLRLSQDGAVLTLPSADITLPTWTALWDRKIVVQKLVAKGWTLDLSGRNPGKVERVVAKPPNAGATGSKQVEANAPPPAGDSPAEEERTAARSLPVDGTVAPSAARGFLGLPRGWQLPMAMSWDGVELQGEVLLAADSGQEPIRASVTVTGGGIGAGQQGELALDALVSVPNSGRWPAAYGADGRLGIAMKTARTLDRMEFNGRLTARGQALPDDLRVSAGLERSGTSSETCRVDFTRGDRHVLIVSAPQAEDKARINGTWTLDLRVSDLAGLFTELSLPAGAAEGKGNFETDAHRGRFRATGRLAGEIGRLKGASSSASRVEGLKFKAGIELARAGRSLQIERLDVSVAGANPVAQFRCVQPFTFDEATGTLAVVDPSGDWIEGTLQGLPMAWLSGVVTGVVFSGGDATGDFAAKLAKGDISLRSKSPLHATGVSLQKDGRVVAQGLDLSVALLAEKSSRGWQWHGAPMVLSSAGRQLASFEVNVTPPPAGGRITAIGAIGSADLEALAALPVIPGLPPIPWRSVTGSLAASVGPSSEVTAQLNLAGPGPDQAVAAKVRAHANALGQISFNAPFTITSGKKAAEISAEGTWTAEKEGGRLNLDMGAVSADVEPLQQLAASLLAASGVAWTGAPVTGESRGPLAATAGRDLQPFWGEWRGHIRFHAYQLRTGDLELRQVAGAIAVDRGTLRLEASHGTLATPSAPVKDEPVHRRPKAVEPPSRVVTLEGTVSFDGAADLPYRLEAKVGVDAVDAAQLLGSAKAKSEQCVEGSFAVAATFGSTGTNLPNLIERRKEEFRLTGMNGILRLLKTNVAAAIPDQPSKGSEVLAGASTLLGAVLGVGKNALYSGVKTLPKPMEAVLNFTYQIPEVRYDELVVTARRSAKGPIDLTGFTMNAPKLRLTGNGRISPLESQPIGQGTLELELKLGARDNFAVLLTTAGLLSADKDEAGYAWMREPLRLGGTLEQVDDTQWRDLLLKAAMPPKEQTKKK